MVVVLEGPDGALVAVYPSLAQRVRACLLAASCDRRLARGESPEHDLCLAVRAERLVRAETRQWLARSLQRLLDEALDGPRPTPSPWSPGRRQRLALSAEDIVATIDELHRPAPLSSQGLAALCDLLRDGSGPLHGPGSAQDLSTRLCQVRQQLMPVSIWSA